MRRISYNSPVILTFAIMSFVALIINILTNGTANYLVFSVHRGSVYNPLTYIRLFTHILGHANFSHYVNNFMIILLVGPSLEEKYGSKNMVYMILITAFVTGIISITLFNVVLLGASGIAFMMILLSSFTNFEKGTIPLTLILVVIMYLGKEVVDGLVSSDNVSQFAHIIGGVCGAFFGFKLNNKNNNTNVRR